MKNNHEVRIRLSQQDLDKVKNKCKEYDVSIQNFGRRALLYYASKFKITIEPVINEK